METQEIKLSVSKDQIEDLRTLLFQEMRRSYVTGGSQSANDDNRRRDSFRRIYDQLPPGRAPDVQES